MSIQEKETLKHHPSATNTKICHQIADLTITSCPAWHQNEAMVVKTSETQLKMPDPARPAWPLWNKVAPSQELPGIAGFFFIACLFYRLFKPTNDISNAQK